MNDKIIIRIIKKIHFNLLAFFLFVFLAGFFIFVALLEGFTISHLKFGDIKFERLYLKWDNRLTVKASLIDLNELHRNNEPLTLKPLAKITDSVTWMQRWVSIIDIQAIQYRNTNVSLHYNKNTHSALDIHVGRVWLDGNFTLSPQVLTLSISSKSGSTAHINGHLNLYLQQQKLNASGQLKLPNTPTINVFSVGDQKSINLSVTADQSFSRIDELVDFLEVDPQARPWISDYAKINRLTLQHCHGSFLYDQPQKLLQSLVVKASVYNAQYTFAPSIAPIIAPKVDLLFKNGILNIFPENGHFYNIPTQKSHLFIDFNPKHTMLNAHIFTDHAQLNDSILNLLNYYKISVPIRQNSGTCHVDLKLIIDLNNFNTTAKGKFIPGKSELQIENFIFQTMGGIVTLDTSKVLFSGFDAYYKNTLHATVQGYYDAHTGKGDVQILPISCSPTGDAQVFSLLTLHSAAKAIYHIDPHNDTLQILPTQWKVFGETLNIEGFTIPYDFKHSSAVLPKLRYWVPDKIQGSIQGKLSSDTWWLYLGFDSFNAQDLVLRSDNCTLTITGDRNAVNIKSNAASSWKLNGQDFSLSPLSVRVSDDKILFNNIKVDIETIIQGYLSGEYLWKLNKGSILLDDMTPLNPNISGYLNLNKSQKFSLSTNEKQLTIHSQSMGIDFSTMDQGWKITVPDISLLSINSPILHQYEIDRGQAELFYNPRDKRYTFNGTILYPYHLMVVHDQILSTYKFSGSYQNGKSVIRVNDRLQIDYGESINIRSNNMGINAPELARWLEIPQKKQSSQENEVSTPIHLNATNTYLYLTKNRTVMADTLNASLNQGNLEARMTYAEGFADLFMKNGIYYVEGSHFNDIFMKHLFAFSDFKGGQMSFKLSGKADDFEGVMRIENALLKEYKLLNNVLSFINTVPSLATFSVPNYNTRGLPLKEAYSHYNFRNHQFTVDNFTLNSPELKMAGEGKINFKEDTIKGSLTLKTDLGSQLGRVPLVGYILFGNDGSISTTVNIKGKLSDPIVETAIAKEIISAPFNILKRTITYPFLWMMEDEKKK